MSESLGVFLSDAKEEEEDDLTRFKLEMDPETDLAKLDLDRLLVMSRFTEDVAVSVLFFKFVVSSRRSEFRLCICN